MFPFYLALALDDASRTALRSMWPPQHSVLFGDHITIQYDSISEQAAKMLNTKPRVTVLGYAADDRIDCALVMVNGDVLRPDGLFYHVTMSCAKGVKAYESNILIRRSLDNRRVRYSYKELQLNGMVRMLTKSDAKT